MKTKKLALKKNNVEEKNLCLVVYEKKKGHPLASPLTWTKAPKMIEAKLTELEY